MISDSSLTILNFMKQHYGQEFSKDELASTLSLSPRAVTGAVNGINGMVKKGYMSERVEEVEVEPATENRKAKTRTIRYETLTEKGLAYDPVAEEEAKQLAAAAQRVQKTKKNKVEEDF